MFKWFWRALILVVLLPFGLTLVYKINSVRPVSTLMLADYLTGRKVERQWVDLDVVAPVLVYSVMISEDGKFCSHSGVDWDAVNTVIVDAFDGAKIRGASTLSMQAVKNLFLWNSRSYLRKMLEVPLALYLDAILSKQRIMEIYLNIAEWDDGVFGIEAAALNYFNIPAKQLSARQSALLAVALPDPKGRNPANPTRSLNRVANVVQERTRQAGAYIGCLRK